MLDVVAQSNGAQQKTMKVMISGAPATGKGTQCLRILDKVRMLACTVDPDFLCKAFTPAVLLIPVKHVTSLPAGCLLR